MMHSDKNSMPHCRHLEDINNDYEKDEKNEYYTLKAREEVIGKYN